MDIKTILFASRKCGKVCYEKCTYKWRQEGKKLSEVKWSDWGTVNMCCEGSVKNYSGGIKGK